MKSRLLAVFLLIILVAFSFVYGAGKGWSNERAQVDEQLSTLQNHLDTRVETACNILTVAGRHMSPEDELLISLADARDTLSGSSPLSEKASANIRMARDAEKLLAHLLTLSSVQNDERDFMYVNSMLPQMLRESENYTAASAYNTAAEGFNERYDRNKFSSTVAGMLGVKRCEVFSSAGED